jgi:1-acyl-sn-glycerol-3-phosphate acyltransferase
VASRSRLLGTPIVRTLLSVWAWFLLGLVIVVWLPLVFIVWLATLPFDKGRYRAGYVFRKLTVVHQTLNPLWKFRTSGVRIADPRRPYVVVANHQSFVDMLLISHLPWEMKWLAKQDFFRYPVVGWMMRMAGDIKLIRGEKQAVIAAMDQCHDRLEKNVSVMIFPEGTRSHDGTLGEFKDGAFRLAIEGGYPILPLALNGTYEALHKGDWRFGVTEAEVRVLEPIETAGMTKTDLPELRDRVRTLIAEQVTALREGR